MYDVIIIGAGPGGIFSAYELMQEKDFPTFKVGSRKLVEKEKFRKWVDEHSGGGK